MREEFCFTEFFFLMQNGKRQRAVVAEAPPIDQRHLGADDIHNVPQGNSTPWPPPAFNHSSQSTAYVNPNTAKRRIQRARSADESRSKERQANTEPSSPTMIKMQTNSIEIF